MIIELTPEHVEEWSIIKDVSAAVDALLSGRSYQVERRTRLKQDLKEAGSENVIFRLAFDKVANRGQGDC
ncbi:unnamed protein product [Laminaria digitata]